MDDEGLSVTFDKVKLAGVDTVTLKDVNGEITAEIESELTLGCSEGFQDRETRSGRRLISAVKTTPSRKAKAARSLMAY